MKYILQVIGILLLIVAVARMFGIFDAVITSDMLWLSILFGGILVCMCGFWLEEYQSKPVSELGRRQRVSKMASCRNAVCLCMVVLLFIASSFI